MPLTITLTLTLTQVSTIGRVAEGEWMWHGAALAANGCIYGVPSNGERVLKVEVATGAVTYVGEPLRGRNKWCVLPPTAMQKLRIRRMGGLG